MAAKFTPGPWRVEYNDNADFKAYEVVGPNANEWVAECGYGGNAEACANLIAAAPTMHEALSHAYSWLIDPQGWEREHNQKGLYLPIILRAALAKAEGRNA